MRDEEVAQSDARVVTFGREDQGGLVLLVKLCVDLSVKLDAVLFRQLEMPLRLACLGLLILFVLESELFLQLLFAELRGGLVPLLDGLDVRGVSSRDLGQVRGGLRLADRL